MEDRICPVCKRELKQRKDERKDNFQRRVTCGKPVMRKGKVVRDCAKEYKARQRALVGNSFNLPANMGNHHKVKPEEKQIVSSLELAKKEAEARGLKFDYGRVLTDQEAVQLYMQGKITPIEQIRGGEYSLQGLEPPCIF
jgi:hypothetical protein